MTSNDFVLQRSLEIRSSTPYLCTQSVLSTENVEDIVYGLKEIQLPDECDEKRQIMADVKENCGSFLTMIYSVLRQKEDDK